MLPPVINSKQDLHTTFPRRKPSRRRPSSFTALEISHAQVTPSLHHTRSGHHGVSTESALKRNKLVKKGLLLSCVMWRPTPTISIPKPMMCMHPGPKSTLSLTMSLQRVATLLETNSVEVGDELVYVLQTFAARRLVA